jgi:hypothetical protein
MLIDDVCRVLGDRTPPWPLVPRLDRAVVFDISAIYTYADQVLQLSTVQVLDWSRELPVLAPLAPVAWFEWSTGRSLRAVCCAVIVDLACAPGETLYDLGHHEAAILEHAVRSDARWVLLCAVLGRNFSTSDPTAICLSRYDPVIYVGADGAVVGLQEGRSQDHDMAHDERVFGRGDVHLALLAHCFAHCKGVTLMEHEQPRQQRRAAEREGRPPLVTYKTLDIEPLKRLLAQQGQIESTGQVHALSLCRGHFKHWAAGTYMGRADAPPLTLFCPAHVRGRRQNGVVLKDYRVRTEA